MVRGRRDGSLLEQAQQEQRRYHHEQRGGGRRPAGAVAAVLVAAAVLHEHAEGAGSAHALGAFLVTFEPSAVAHSAKVAVHFLDDLPAYLSPGTRRKVFLDTHVTIDEIRGNVVERVGAVGIVGRVAAPAIDGPAFVHKHQREENNSYEGYLRTAGDGHRSGITGGGGERKEKSFSLSSRRRRQSQGSFSSTAFSEARVCTRRVHSAARVGCVYNRRLPCEQLATTSGAGIAKPGSPSLTTRLLDCRKGPGMSPVPLVQRKMQQTHLALL